jgi:hypothetical protein
MQFKNFLNLFESYLSNKSFGLNENLLLFFEGQQGTFALSLLNNDQNLLSQLKTNIEEKHLPVAAYWLSKGTNINQVLEIMEAYIELADKNIIKANVTKSSMTLDSKKTKQEPMPDFIYFVNTVDANQMKQRFNNPKQEDIEIDAENLKILYQQNNITVYEANSPQACVTLGKGHSFCISKPAGTMWQSYRDTQTSTFHFVKDQNRSSNDPLRLVVVDMTEYGPQLTDVNNHTGNIAEYGENTERYFEYLRKMGVPTDIFTNMPKTREEIEEEKLLGRTNKDLDWFKRLDIFQQSKYIGRGHELSDEQFDYLWNENEQKLLNQYVSIGRSLYSYQLNKVASKTSLKNSYFKAREQAVSGGDDKYEDDEFFIMNPEQQKNSILKKMVDVDSIFLKAAKKGNMDVVELVINNSIYFPPDHKNRHKSMFDMDQGLMAAAENGQLDMVKHLIKYLMDEEEDDYYGALSGALNAASKRPLVSIEVVKHLIDNYDFDQNSSINPLFDLAKYGDSKVFKKLYSDKKFLAYDLNTMLSFAAEGGNLDIVKYLIDEKGATDIEGALAPAEKYNNKYIIDYLQQKLKKLKDFHDTSLSGDVEKVKKLTDIDFKDKHTLNAALRNVSSNGDPTIDHLNVVKHFVEKGADEFLNAMFFAAEAGNLDLVKYFVEEKGVKSLDYALVAASNSKSKNTKNIVKTIKYLISKGGTDRIEDALKKAIVRGNLDIIKTLIDETDGVLLDEALYITCWQGNFEVVKYLIQREKYSNDVLQTAISYAKKHKKIADYIKNILSSDV